MAELQELIQAARNDDPSTLGTLLDEGADVNARDSDCHGSTLLITAVASRSVSSVVLLIERGADIDAQDDSGYTALITACILGHCDTASILVRNNADIDIKEKRGLTGLDMARDRGHKDIVQLLETDQGDRDSAALPYSHVCCETCNVASVAPDGKYLCTLEPWAVKEVHRGHSCAAYERRL